MLRRHWKFRKFTSSLLGFCWVWSPALAAILLCQPLTAQSPSFLYSANGFSDDVSGYSINPTTGALTPVPGSPFLAANRARVTEAGPHGIGTDPFSRFAYVTNVDTNNVFAYVINSSNGALIPIPGSPFPAGSSPHAIAVEPSGKFAYVENWASNTLSAYTVNQQTGVLATIPGSPFPTGPSPAFNVAPHPNGRLLYIPNSDNDGQRWGPNSSVSGYVIDPQTGGLTNIPGSPFRDGNGPYWWVSIDPRGRFAYTCNDLSGSINAFQIDQTTGVLSPIAGSPFLGGPGGLSMAIDPRGRFLFKADQVRNTVSAFVIDQSSGSLSPVAGSPFALVTPISHVIVDPTGTFLYTANTNANSISGFRINQNTGSLTVIPGSPFRSGRAPLFLAVATPIPASQLGVQFVQPTKGGNAGVVTMQVVGNGFQSGAVLKLTGLGADILGTNTSVPNASVLTTTFDLHGASPGVRNVVVTNPDNTSISLPAAFTVEQGGAPQLWVDIIGRDKIRIGREQTYYITYGNRGALTQVRISMRLPQVAVT